MPREVIPLWQTRVVNQTLRTHYPVDEVTAFGEEWIYDVLDLRAELLRQTNMALKKPKTPPELLLWSEVLMQLI